MKRLFFILRPEMNQPQRFTLKNTSGTRISLTNVGASIMDIQIADRQGKLLSVVAGFDRPEQYMAVSYQHTNLSLGASVGRVAGRISGGGFSLDGKFYPVYQNEGRHLHSEHCGFQHQLWVAEPISDTAIRFVLRQEENCGYPGTVAVNALYELSEENVLSLTYSAKTDKPTVINMCNHAYFNLNGGGSVLDHKLRIAADHFLETTTEIIPTGKLLPVEQHNLDFRNSTVLKAQLGQGLDHAFNLNGNSEVAELYAPKTGIGLKISSNQKAVVVYTPPSLSGQELSNKTYVDHPAICLEMQGFPDAPNHENFPSIRLNPGEEYLNKTSYAFYLD